MRNVQSYMNIMDRLATKLGESGETLMKWSVEDIRSRMHLELLFVCAAVVITIISGIGLFLGVNELVNLVEFDKVISNDFRHGPADRNVAWYIVWGALSICSGVAVLINLGSIMDHLKNMVYIKIDLKENPEGAAFDNLMPLLKRLKKIIKK